MLLLYLIASQSAVNRRSELSPTQRFEGDKAYVGELLIDTHTKRREVEILLLLKKPKINQRLKKEFLVEHLIRLVKIFRVAAERFRLKIDRACWKRAKS